MIKQAGAGATTDGAQVRALELVGNILGLVLVIAASVVGAMGGGFVWLVHTLVGGLKSTREC